MSSLEEAKLQAEIDKIRAETQKLEAEIHALKKPVLFKPTAWIPLLAGIAALGGSVTQWLQTAGELRAAKQQEKQLVSYTEGLRNRQEMQARNTKAELENKLTAVFEKQLASLKSSGSWNSSGRGKIDSVDVINLALYHTVVWTNKNADLPPACPW